MIHKDLNLFDVYRKSLSEKSNRGNKVLIFLAIVMVAAVAVIYALFFINRMAVEGDINKIDKQFARPEVIEAQNVTAKEAEKNGYLQSYYDAVASMSDVFDRTNYINSELITKILGIMPKDVSISSISINQRAISMGCTCASINTSALMVQNLNASEYFANVSYNGVSGQDGSYSFSIAFDYIGVGEAESDE